MRAVQVHHKLWRPIKVTNNVHVQLVKMLCFKTTQTSTITINNARPRTGEGLGLEWGMLLVTSVDFTCSVFEGASHMMLSGSDIRKNSGTETTLIGDN